MDYEEPVKVQEFLLNSDHFKALSDILPTGFTLQPVAKQNKRESYSKSKKAQSEVHSINNMDSQSEAPDDLSLKNKQSSTQKVYSADTISKNGQQSPISQSGREQRSLRQKRNKITGNSMDMDGLGLKKHFSVCNLSDDMRKCFKILQDLKKKSVAGPFLYPVNPVELNCLDYFDKIKEPIDIQTVENQLKAGVYISPQQFAADVRKIWSNSFTYNQQGSQIYVMTLEMHNSFDKLYKDSFESNSNWNIGKQSMQQLQDKVKQLSEEIVNIKSGKKQRPGLKTNKRALGNKKMYKQMTMNEKQILGQNIRALPREHLKGIWEIVCKGNLNNQNREILKFDINNLPIDKARELEMYVKQRLHQLNKQKAKKTGPKGKQVGAGQKQMVPNQQTGLQQEMMMNQAYPNQIYDSMQSQPYENSIGMSQQNDYQQGEEIVVPQEQSIENNEEESEQESDSMDSDSDEE